MRRLFTVVLLSALAAPVAARGDGSIQLVAAGGAAKPFGDVANGVKMADSIDWAFPLDAQLQFRIVKHLALGAYARYTPTSVGSSCSGCTLTGLAFGARAEYRLGERLEGGGWLGAFLGYEQLESEVEGAAATVTRTLSGVEGGAAGGVDFELGGLTVGPYLQLTVGQYSKQSGAGVSSTIASKGMHGFFGAGVRVGLLL